MVVALARFTAPAKVPVLLPFSAPAPPSPLPLKIKASLEVPVKLASRVPPLTVVAPLVLPRLAVVAARRVPPVMVVVPL